MKKILIFPLILTVFSPVEASFLHKALGVGVSVTAVAATALKVKHLYDVVGASKNPLSSEAAKSLGFKLFGEETQNALREHFKAIYTCEKPLYFGVTDLENNAFASSGRSANYVFFGYGLLPKFNSTEQPQPFEDETHEEFSSRFRDYMKINLKETQESEEFFLNPPIKEFKEKLKTISFVTKHEMGHLVYEHTQKQMNHYAKLGIGMAVLTTGLSGYLVKGSFAKNITTMGLLGKIAAIVSFVAITNVYSVYKQNEFSMPDEEEADDFALKNAESLEELIDAKAFFEEMLKTETGAAERSSLAHFSLKYMPSHPCVSSRIEKIQKAIDNWKK